jgi:hypothetical protein
LLGLHRLVALGVDGEIDDHGVLFDNADEQDDAQERVGSASTPFVYKVRPGRLLPRSSSMPALKVLTPFSSACLLMPRPTRCGPVS